MFITNMEKEKKLWHPQQEKILKTWGEASACYRYMNNQAFLMYKKSSMRYTLPIIVISTVTGTANFAQSTFPNGMRPLVPLAIGSMNIITAIMTTVMQFLKINELMEGHRAASIQYGKLSRTIRLELSLPLEERSQTGRRWLNIAALNMTDSSSSHHPYHSVSFSPLSANFQMILRSSNLKSCTYTP